MSRGERDVHRLVVETGLPQSSVYRKLRELSEGGLVAVDRLAFTPEGRKVELFRSRVREVRAMFQGGKVQVEVVKGEDGAERLREIWEDVRRFGR